MATPTNLPATFVTGNVLTAAQQNALRGAFRVLQVVSFSSTGGATGSSSATFVDTGVSASITPQSTSSKILIMVNHSAYSFGAGTTGTIVLLRNSTTLQTFYDVCYNPAASNLTTTSGNITASGVITGNSLASTTTITAGSSITATGTVTANGT